MRVALDLGIMRVSLDYDKNESPVANVFAVFIQEVIGLAKMQNAIEILTEFTQFIKQKKQINGSSAKNSITIPQQHQHQQYQQQLSNDQAPLGNPEEARNISFYENNQLQFGSLNQKEYEQVARNQHQQQQQQQEQLTLANDRGEIRRPELETKKFEKSLLSFGSYNKKDEVFENGGVGLYNQGQQAGSSEALVSGDRAQRGSPGYMSSDSQFQGQLVLQDGRSYRSQQTVLGNYNTNALQATPVVPQQAWNRPMMPIPQQMQNIPQQISYRNVVRNGKSNTRPNNSINKNYYSNVGGNDDSNLISHAKGNSLKTRQQVNEFNGSNWPHPYGTSEQVQQQFIPQQAEEQQLQVDEVQMIIESLSEKGPAMKQAMINFQNMVANAKPTQQEPLIDEFVQKLIKFMVAQSDEACENSMYFIEFALKEKDKYPLFQKTKTLVRKLNQELRFQFEVAVGGFQNPLIVRLAQIRAGGIHAGAFEFCEIVEEMMSEYLQVGCGYDRFTAGLAQLAKLIMECMDDQFRESQQNKSVVQLLEDDKITEFYDIAKDKGCYYEFLGLVDQVKATLNDDV